MTPASPVIHMTRTTPPSTFADTARDPWSERRETRKQVARFLVVGLCCVGVDLTLYGLLVWLTPMHTMPAKGISYVTGMIVGFVWNKAWTFESRRASWTEPASYTLLYGVTLAANIGVNELARTPIAAVLEWTALPAPAHVPRLAAGIAVLLATGITTVLNFLGLRFITFQKGIAQRRQRAMRSEPGASA